MFKEKNKKINNNKKKSKHRWNMLTCLVLIKKLKLIPFFILVMNDFFLADDRSLSRQNPKIQPSLWWPKTQGFFWHKK